MRALPFLALLSALLAPGLVCAEPLRAALPEYHVLSSSESESFEPALLQALAESLEETVDVAERSEAADLQLGPAKVGPVYYQAVPPLQALIRSSSCSASVRNHANTPAPPMR